MIEEDEQIIFVSQGKAIYIIKQENSLITGFVEKKIVVTTRRCLFFQSLTNKVQELQYQIVSKKKLNQQNPNQEGPTLKSNRLSVNEYPEYWFEADSRQAKVLIDQQPTALKYFQKLGIKNLIKTTTGMVLMKNLKKYKFQVLLFPTMKDSFRFCKAIQCAKAWTNYQAHCYKHSVTINQLWFRILQQIIAHQNSLTLIDPDLFDIGSTKQIESFLVLIRGITFAHSFQLRFSITTQQSSEYALDFIKALQDRIHSLTMSKASLSSDIFFKLINHSGVKIKELVQLNLQNNNLNDHAFFSLQTFVKQHKKLSYINLSYNQITLDNFSYFLQFMKATPVILNLNLSHNKIHDKAVQSIQKFILFALNPPIEEIDFSFNLFTKKATWRLYVDFLKNFKAHTYMNFMIYPIPFKKQIFSEISVDFPRPNDAMNMNMHSALVQEFQQESMMKNTFVQVLNPNTLTIKFIRHLVGGVTLPKNKQQVSKTLQLSNKMENFTYSTQSVERIYDLALTIKAFPFQVQPKTINRFTFFLGKKLNQALFIRDHYSIKFILKSIKILQISYEGYIERLKLVDQRDSIFRQRFENILDFKHDQNLINIEIDEVVKESLRLYLQGKGIDLLYYLKYIRDQHIEKLLSQRYNPEHEIYSKMAKKNISLEERITSQDFMIPYEIKIEKKINQNFYLHPWQTNYLVLSQMTVNTFNECLEFLEQSDKRQKFAKYFQRIQERVEFIKNQFTFFTYKKFKVSYSDLRVNACRLLFLYKNIQQTNFFIQIPIQIKKKPISCQNIITVKNIQRFMRQYHISNYPNLSSQAKKAMFYNYQGIITRYESQKFHNEIKKTLFHVNQILRGMQKDIKMKEPKQKMLLKVIPSFKKLIDVVRHSIYPQQSKQEIYLHFIGWRNGKSGGNTQVLELMPLFSMYLKPPLTIQKYLIAALLQNDKLDFRNLPICHVSDLNKPTPDNIQKLDYNFVERDWWHNDHIFSQLMLNNGKIMVQFELLDKRKIKLLVSQSKTISETMQELLKYPQLNCEDRQSFWLYTLSKQTQETLPLTGSDYIGQIISVLIPQQSMLIIRRRMYCRQLNYVYNRYGEALINSLYFQVRFQYLMRGFFVNDKDIYDLASLLYIIDHIQAKETRKKTTKQDREIKFQLYLLDELKRLDISYTSYIPRQTLLRIMKDKDSIITQLKTNISQRMLRKEHLAIYEMKTNFLKYFQSYPEFCSTNYRLTDKDSNQIKVSINCMYIFIESEYEKQEINLERIISIVPKSRYVLIVYHKNQNVLGQLPLFGSQENTYAVSMDLLSYFMMRLKMVSGNLYEINKYQRIEKEIVELEKNLKKVYNKNQEKKLFKNRQQKLNIQMKITKMSMTLMDLKELVYYNKSKYIKSFINRKLYANKSQKKMQFKVQMDQEQESQTSQWNHNMFKTVFPQHQMTDFKKKPHDYYLKDQQSPKKNSNNINMYSQRETKPNQNNQLTIQEAKLQYERYAKQLEEDQHGQSLNDRQTEKKSNQPKENRMRQPQSNIRNQPYYERPQQKDKYNSTVPKNNPKQSEQYLNQPNKNPKDPNLPLQINDDDVVVTTNKKKEKPPPRRRR